MPLGGTNKQQMVGMAHVLQALRVTTDVPWSGRRGLPSGQVAAVQFRARSFWLRCAALYIRSATATLNRLYTVSQKKQDTKLLSITSANYYPIFKLYSLADSVVNLQQNRV